MFIINTKSISTNFNIQKVWNAVSKCVDGKLGIETGTLKSNVTWMKSICISCSIKIVIIEYIEKVQRTDKKKLDHLFEKKQQEDGLDNNNMNPNNIMNPKYEP